ncbi:hypothetical protein ACROYT_G019388 [Oculina patagonica]
MLTNFHFVEGLLILSGARRFVSCSLNHFLAAESLLIQEFADEPGDFEQPSSGNSSQVESGVSKRVVCSVCSCTFLEGEECIRCEQDREYESSRIADGGGSDATENSVPLTVDEIRSRRVAALSSPSSSERVLVNEGSNGSVTEGGNSSRLLTEESTNYGQGSAEERPPSSPNSDSRDQLQERILTIHRTCVRTDLIEHFKDPSVMNCNINFRIINERGDLEPGVGIGVNCEAFVCYCLFGDQVPDNLFIDSFTKYLSPVEEELILDDMRKNELPDEGDEFSDFLERFQCRRVVNNGNLNKVILEIVRQEGVEALPPFQAISNIEALYDSLKPTTKKVLSCLISNPVNEGERDAFKFLQRFIRGLDMSKLQTFLQFTTGMDILVGKKIEVTFIKCEGLRARPIAHTCGPLLEIPSTYPNYVEFREEFTNVLSRDTWEIDIV